MRALPTRNVPSSSLLKYLRSQTDTLCFFTANSNPGCVAALWPHQKHTRTSSIPNTYQASSRALCTTSRRNATLEASILNLDFLSKPDGLQAPSGSRSHRPEISLKQTSQAGWALLKRWNHNEQESWRRWFHLRKKAKEKPLPLRPSDLPPLPFLSDASGATLGRMKATNELKLRCTEFDENGSVVVVDAEFKKSELIAKVHLPSFQ